MVRKRKIIWWEREPLGTDAAQARLRGSHEGSGRSRPMAAPYYGPVTVLIDVDGDDDTPGVATY